MHRLPDGSETDNVDKYLDAWEELCKPLEKAIGMLHYAFDPDVGFSCDDKSSISLPVWFILKLNEALKDSSK